MAADQPLAVVQHVHGLEGGVASFVHEVAHEGRLVTRLVGVESTGHAVRVVAEIYPVHAPEAGEPQWRFYDFASRDRARRFVDETLLALEYLGCAVRDGAAAAELPRQQGSSSVAA